MALQTIGPISMRDIADELGVNPNTSISLGAMSNAAGFTGSDSMSEFYGYDDNPVNWTSFTSKRRNSTSSASCAETLTFTLYHDGSFTVPQINDRLYTTQTGTATPTSGYYGWFGSAFFVSNAGYVISQTSCGGGIGIGG